MAGTFWAGSGAPIPTFDWQEQTLVLEQINYKNVDNNPDATYAVLGEQRRAVRQGTVALQKRLI